MFKISHFLNHIGGLRIKRPDMCVMRGGPLRTAYGRNNHMSNVQQRGHPH